MIKTVFIPAQAIAKLMVGCGGGKGNKGMCNVFLVKSNWTATYFRYVTIIIINKTNTIFFIIQIQ